jgi:hypothetical protein
MKLENDPHRSKLMKKKSWLASSTYKSFEKKKQILPPLPDPDVQHYVDELAILFKKDEVNRILNESIVKNIGSSDSSHLNRTNSPRSLFKHCFLDRSFAGESLHGQYNQKVVIDLRSCALPSE